MTLDDIDLNLLYFIKQDLVCMSQSDKDLVRMSQSDKDLVRMSQSDKDLVRISQSDKDLVRMSSEKYFEKVQQVIKFLFGAGLEFYLILKTIFSLTFSF